MDRKALLLEAARLEPLCQPTRPGAEDVAAMNARVQRLDLLFEAADRANAKTGLRNTYTGLHQQPPF